MNKLLPCPFCGGNGRYYYQPDVDNTGCKHCHNVCCDNCAATTGMCISDEAAFSAWNRRADAKEDKPID